MVAQELISNSELPHADNIRFTDFYFYFYFPFDFGFIIVFVYVINEHLKIRSFAVLGCAKLKHNCQQLYRRKPEIQINHLKIVACYNLYGHKIIGHD